MTERVAVLLTPEQLQQIDDYRFANRIGSRGEAIRQLLAIALATEHNKSANA